MTKQKTGFDQKSHVFLRGGIGSSSSIASKPYTSVEKGLKLKVIVKVSCKKKFLEVTREKLVLGLSGPPSPLSRIRVKVDYQLILVDSIIRWMWNICYNGFRKM